MTPGERLQQVFGWIGFASFEVSGAVAGSNPAPARAA